MKKVCVNGHIWDDSQTDGICRQCEKPFEEEEYIESLIEEKNEYKYELEDARKAVRIMEMEVGILTEKIDKLQKRIYKLESKE